jgi:hypothetical protein
MYSRPEYGDNATERVDATTERVDATAERVEVCTGNRYALVGFLRPHQTFPKLLYATLMPLTTRAASMQIGLNVHLDVLSHIVKFEINRPLGS